MAVKTTKKIPYCSGTDVIALGITFSLDINPVQAKGVLIDNAVDTIVATSTDCPPSIGCRTSKAHTEEQIDYQAFEKIRRGSANSIKKLLRKRRIYLTMCHAHDFIGCFGPACEGSVRRLHCPW